MNADSDLITDVLLRTGYLGAIFSVAGWWWFGWNVGAGVAVGTVLAIVNTQALRFVLDRLIPESDELDSAETPSERDSEAHSEQADQDESSSAAIWATGLFLKTTLLLATAYLAMALLGVHPLGLAFGYSLLLPGLSWAWWRYLRRRDENGGSQGESETSPDGPGRQDSK